MNHIRKRKNERRGAVIVEFALTAPILLLLVFGAIEFSRANMLVNTAGLAATEGARAGIVPGATAADVEAAVQRELDVLGIQESAIVTSPAVITDNTAFVAVGVQVPVNARNGYLVPRFFLGKNVTKLVALQREVSSKSSDSNASQVEAALASVTDSLKNAKPKAKKKGD